MTAGALRHRIRADGPWMVVLPGVYACQKGTLSIGQRERAAALYAGGEYVITGVAALIRQGVRAPAVVQVDVLIPVRRRRQSISFVVVHRTRQMPVRPLVASRIRYAPVARAIADTVRGGLDGRSTVALVASAVQRSRCTLGELAAELRAGPPWGLGPLREAIAETTSGTRSVAEGDLRKLIIRGGLPTPLYNPQLLVGSVLLARPDAWWPEAGVACEVDSAEWHLSPTDWKKTQTRHARMSAQGIIVLHYAPNRIRYDGKSVLTEIGAAIEHGLRRPRLPITTVAADGTAG